MGSGHLLLLIGLLVLLGILIGSRLWQPFHSGRSGQESMSAHVARRPCWSIRPRPARKGNTISSIDAQGSLFVGRVHALERDAVVLLLPDQQYTAADRIHALYYQRVRNPTPGCYA